LLRRPNISATVERQLGPTDIVQGKQKAPTHDEKGLQKIRALFSFSPDTRRGWIWHLALNLHSTGCRGVIGPVPQPLCMRPLHQRMWIS
jgi:hypothetical protein